MPALVPIKKVKKINKRRNALTKEKITTQKPKNFNEIVKQVNSNDITGLKTPKIKKKLNTL